MEGKVRKVRTPVASWVKRGHTYAQAGEDVTVIKDYGDVLIVELNGNRFPVSPDKLFESNEIDDTQSIKEPAVHAVVPPKNRAVSRKGRSGS